MLELAGSLTEALRDIVMVLRAPGSGLFCPRVFTSKMGLAPCTHGWLEMTWANAANTVATATTVLSALRLKDSCRDDIFVCARNGYKWYAAAEHLVLHEPNVATVSCRAGGAASRNATSRKAFLTGLVDCSTARSSEQQFMEAESGSYHWGRTEILY